MFKLIQWSCFAYFIIFNKILIVRKMEILFNLKEFVTTLFLWQMEHWNQAVETSSLSKMEMNGSQKIK